MYIPRIGHEVIVDFLEGDPDRPIITGRVYHGSNQPPYSLPGEKSKSTLKSDSSPDGEGFNEIRFEDKKGKEQIFFHAERNMDIRVKNDSFETTGNDHHLVVDKDKREHVKNERHEIVDSHHYEKIGGDLHLKVVGKQAVAIDQSLSLTVGSDVAEVFKANHAEQVAGDYFLKAANIVIEATSNVTIKVGGSFIAIEAGGIKIGTGGQVVVEAGADASVMGTAGLNLESPAITVVKGSLVKIN